MQRLLCAGSENQTLPEVVNFDADQKEYSLGDENFIRLKKMRIWEIGIPLYVKFGKP